MKGRLDEGSEEVEVDDEATQMMRRRLPGATCLLLLLLFFFLLVGCGLLASETLLVLVFQTVLAPVRLLASVFLIVEGELGLAGRLEVFAKCGALKLALDLGNLRQLLFCLGDLLQHRLNKMAFNVVYDDVEFVYFEVHLPELELPVVFLLLQSDDDIVQFVDSRLKLRLVKAIDFEVRHSAGDDLRPLRGLMLLLSLQLLGRLLHLHLLFSFRHLDKTV